MMNLRVFLSCSAAGAALFFLTAPSQGQFRPQTFVSPRSVGGAFRYQPYQLPFRMPPGQIHSAINPPGAYQYAPRFYQPGGYPFYRYNPSSLNPAPLYVPNVIPSAAPGTPGPLRVF